MMYVNLFSIIPESLWPAVATVVVAILGNGWLTRRKVGADTHSVKTDVREVLESVNGPLTAAIKSISIANANWASLAQKHFELTGTPEARSEAIRAAVAAQTSETIRKDHEAGKQARVITALSQHLEQSEPTPVK